ncbi:MAG: hypothetical protein ACI4HI_17255 [Lachnospiraceae bacterium]
MRKADEKQQALLETFFQKKEIWNPDYYMNNVAGYLFMGISLILLVFPVQVWEFPKDLGIFPEMYIFCLVGISLHLKQYRQYREDGKNKKMYEILKCLPIAQEQLWIFQFRKEVRVCARLAGIVMVCQTVFAISFLHTFSVWNILAPFLAFALPVGINYAKISYP